MLISSIARSKAERRGLIYEPATIHGPELSPIDIDDALASSFAKVFPDESAHDGQNGSHPTGHKGSESTDLGPEITDRFEKAVNLNGETQQAAGKGDLEVTVEK